MKKSPQFWLIVLIYSLFSLAKAENAAPSSPPAATHLDKKEGKEAPKPEPPKYSPHWRPGVRVAPISGEFKNESAIPSPYLSEAEVCYLGLPSAKPGANPFHASVGKKQDRFIIPISENPEKFLEPGDVMVYVRSTPIDSNRLYDHVTRGAWHAAIVTKDSDGKLKHIDSPQSMSGNNFKNGVYHIVRLRKYPKEVTSEEELKKWEADPEKSKILNNWAKRREEILKDVQRYSEALSKAGYTYDTERVTEISDSKKRSDPKKAFDEGKLPKTCLYCSELPATVFALSGIEPPKSASLLESFERVEKTVLPKILEKAPGTDRDEKLKAAVYRMFQDEGVLRELGVTSEQFDRYRKDGELPPTIKMAADQLLMLLKLPPEARRLAVASQGLFSQSKGELVGPADWMDSMYGKDSDFDYVGTYTGNYCNTGNPVDRQRSFTQGENRGDGLTEEQIQSHPNNLKTDRSHLLSITSLAISADGRFLLTVGADDVARLLDLVTGDEKSFRNDGIIKNAKFSPDGKFLLIAHNYRTIMILDLATGRKKNLEVRSGGYSMVTANFSPDGKSILLTLSNGSIKILEVSTSAIKSINGIENAIGSNFSPDGKWVVASDSYGYATRTNLSTGLTKNYSNDVPDGPFRIPLDVWSRYTRAQQTAKVSPDGKSMVMFFKDTLKVVDLTTGNFKKFSHGPWISDVNFSPDSKNVITTVLEGTSKIFNIESGQEKLIADGNGQVYAAKFSPTGNYALVAGSNSALILKNLKTGEVSKVNHNGSVTAANFSPDGKWVASGDFSGRCILQSIKPATLETLREELRTYDGTLYTDQNRREQSLQRNYLALLLGKAKEKGMTKEQAQKLIREEVSTLGYREGDEHLGGILKALWPNR